MNCPRCGSPVTEYALDGQTAVGCTACGWLGVEVEHRAEQAAEESWREAYRRFRNREGDESEDGDGPESERA
jgi:uncharacterized Zn finger protein (UPF0148 family)